MIFLKTEFSKCFMELIFIDRQRYFLYTIRIQKLDILNKYQTKSYLNLYIFKNNSLVQLL